MENRQNIKLNTYKEFFNNGIWDEKVLNTLKDNSIITEEEYKLIIKQPRKAKDTRIANEPYYYEVWDKKSPINNVEAERILKDNSLKNASDVFLIKSPSTGNVLRVESVDIIKDNNRMRANLTVDEVAEFYLEQMEEMANAPQIDSEQVNAGMQIYSKVLELNQIGEIKELLIENNKLLRGILEVLKAG